MSQDECFKSTQDQEDASFNDGFSIGDNEQSGDTQGGDTKDLHAGEQVSTTNKVEDVHPVVPAHSPIPADDVPQYVPPNNAERIEHAQQDPAKCIEVPEHLQEELDALRKMSPEAAELALEDSSDGEAIRARLEQYGAPLASDKAGTVLYQRKQENDARNVHIAREREAVEAHNKHFSSVLQRDHPDVFSIGSDPARQADAAKLMNDIHEWIASKTYAEAQPLMTIAKSGRDPAQVSALISQYKRERGGSTVSPDHTGALAVPGRGAPVAPSGIGDKDDFDAGWEANSSK